MITIKTEIFVDGILGKEITDFLLNCNDENYQKWWNGTHIRLHNLKKYPDNIGNIVFMDEYIGEQRVKMKGIVKDAIPGEKIIWQLKKIIKLPIKLFLELEDYRDGVKIRHTIKLGFKSIGKILDPIFRLKFSKNFEKAMDEHVKIEFPKLRDLLN